MQAKHQPKKLQNKLAQKMEKITFVTSTYFSLIPFCFIIFFPSHNNNDDDSNFYFDNNDDDTHALTPPK